MNVYVVTWRFPGKDEYEVYGVYETFEEAHRAVEHENCFSNIVYEKKDDYEPIWRLTTRNGRTWSETKWKICEKEFRRG